VAENVSVRQVQFNPDGTITDLGATSIGSGMESMVGVIGMQP
jgi:20S proteasome alpha/beta subunit